MRPFMSASSIICFLPRLNKLVCGGLITTCVALDSGNFYGVTIRTLLSVGARLTGMVLLSLEVERTDARMVRVY